MRRASRSTGSRSSATSWPTGGGAITSRPSSASSRPASCPGIPSPGGRGCAWASSPSSPATTGCSPSARRGRITPSRSSSWSPSRGPRRPWPRSRAGADWWAGCGDILDENRSSPLVGTRWALLAGVLVLAAAGAVHAQSAQSRSEAGSPSTSNRPPGTVDPRHRARARRQAGGERRRLLGGSPGNGLPDIALPRDDEARRAPSFQILATAKTDSKGQFVLATKRNPSEHAPFPGIEGFLVAVAPGAGDLFEDPVDQGDQDRVVPPPPARGHRPRPAADARRPARRGRPCRPGRLPQ